MRLFATDTTQGLIQNKHALLESVYSVMTTSERQLVQQGIAPKEVVEGLVECLKSKAREIISGPLSIEQEKRIKGYEKELVTELSTYFKGETNDTGRTNDQV